MFRRRRRANTSHVRRLVLAVFVVSLCSCARAGVGSALTLRIAAVGPLASLTPQADSSYTMMVKPLVYSLLLEPAEGGWRSQVLSDWVQLGFGRYRLKVDPSIRFSDGSPVQNEDVINSLAAFRLRGIERNGWIEVEPTDSGAAIEPLFLRAMLFKEVPQGALGTGPFALVLQDGERVLLRRIKPAPGRIADVELLTYTSAREAFAGALRGDVDLLLMPDPGEVELLDGVSRFRLIRSPALHAIAATFNARRLSSKDRKALAESLPIQDLGRAHRGDCEPDPRRPHSGSTPDGEALHIVPMGTDPSIVRASFALRRALGPRGGTVEVEHRETSLAQIEQALFDIAVVPIQVWPPSIAALEWRSGAPLNYGGYSNPAVDEALNAGDYASAEREMADDPPALLICRRVRSAAVDVRVKNPTLGPYDLLESLPEWEVGQ